MPLLSSEPEPRDQADIFWIGDVSKQNSDYFQQGPLGVWRNKTAAGAHRVLTGDDFIQLQLAEYYEKLAKDFGRDFKNIRIISQYIPLFHDGPKHKNLRKQAAIHLQDISEDLKNFERDASKLIASTFRKEGPHELISELAVPIIQMISYALTKLDHDPGLAEIFSGTNSLKTTIRIDKALGEIFAHTKEQFPDESAQKRVARIMFTVLGSEPLGWTIARSFDTVFKGQTNQPIATLNWTPHFPATGLGLAPRQCRHAPVDLGGVAKAVKIFVLDFNTFISDKSANPNHMFGVGPHACLGRTISLSLWARVIDDMKDNPFKITHISSTPATHKFFEYPGTLHIEVLK